MPRQSSLWAVVLASIAGVVAAAPVPREEYVFAPDTGRWVGVWRNVAQPGGAGGRVLLVGKLDADGVFYEMHRHLAPPADGPEYAVILPALGDGRPAYEYRAGRLIRGKLRDAAFVPDEGSKVIPFSDYHYGPGAPPVWNLPGRFVKKGAPGSARLGDLGLRADDGVTRPESKFSALPLPGLILQSACYLAVNADWIVGLLRPDEEYVFVTDTERVVGIGANWSARRLIRQLDAAGPAVRVMGPNTAVLFVGKLDADGNFNRTRQCEFNGPPSIQPKYTRIWPPPLSMGGLRVPGRDANLRRKRCWQLLRAAQGFSGHRVQRLQIPVGNPHLEPAGQVCQEERPLTASRAEGQGPMSRGLELRTTFRPSLDGQTALRVLLGSA